MKMVKVKTHDGSEIFINLEYIDYIDLGYNKVHLSNGYAKLDDESMKKVVDLIEREVSE